MFLRESYVYGLENYLTGSLRDCAPSARGCQSRVGPEKYYLLKNLLILKIYKVGNHFVQIVLPDPADEAVVLQFVLHPLHLVSQSAERVDDETLGNHWRY